MGNPTTPHAAAPAPARPRTHATSPRIAGLDALRALAVILVVGYHFAPHALRGGYVGVDLFFVISGFLITSILLRERAGRGRVSLRRFWSHRARRLVPALVAVVAVSTAAVTVAGAVAAWGGDPLDGSVWGDLLVGIGAQLAGAATFTSNWLTIALGGSYAAEATPHLFGNLWSLAVEEQFYVVWPVLLTAAIGYGVARRTLARGALAVAGASAIAMALLLGAGSDPSRVYLGTDTHAFGLMIGAALALWWSGRDARELSGDERARAVAMGAVGLAGIVAIAVALPWESTWTYRGGLLLASIAAAAMIHGVVAVPAIGRAIDVAPLRWIGDRSYGIYLWHWPLLVILTAAFDGGRVADGSVLTTTLALLLTLVAAAVSFRWIETPVRRLGFRRAARALVRWSRAPRHADDAPAPRQRPRRRALATAGATLGVVALVSAGVACAPERTALETQLDAGAAALRVDDSTAAATQAPRAEPTTSAVPSRSPSPGPSTSLSAEASGRVAAQGAAGSAGAASPEAEIESHLRAETADEVPLPARVPPPGATEAARQRPSAPSGRDITMVGDSVTLGSAPALEDALPGIAIDAEVGRQFWDGVDVIASLADRGKLRPYVVIALGTNGEVPGDQMDRLLDAARGHHVVLVTPYGDREWIPSSQDAVRKAARAHGDVEVADWEKAVEKDPDVLGPDGIHPDQDGMKVFATVVKQALVHAEP